MPLKLKLKPGERVLIAGALITNGDVPTHFYIENKVPLLREKDIMTENDAKTFCEKIYFVIQLMYFSPQNIRELHQVYWKHVRTLIKASPSMIDLISKISEKILVEKYYDALKLTRDLIEYENKLISHAKESS
ncbi:MAG TPA: flagellar biosynthesis repressor FlbT [Opitutales bacterium]|nr:flagellar biosynthesis repressor FlbT [Opitutales bacterium]